MDKRGTFKLSFYNASFLVMIYIKMMCFVLFLQKEKNRNSQINAFQLIEETRI